MPTLRELITKVGFNVDDRALAIYDKAIGRVYDKADGLYNNLNRVADSISGIGRKLTFMVSAPLAGIGVASVIATGKVEQFQTAFEVMLQSADKANLLMKQLFKFEAQTPFNLEQVMNFAQQLLIAKQPAETLTQELMMLGNVAAGDANRLDRIVYVLGQVRALGYLQGQDIMQFTNALVPIRDALSKTLNVTGAELQRMIEKRKISAEMVQKALEYIAAQRGGLMEKQARTINGLFSSLMSSIFRLRNSLGQLLVDQLKLKPLLEKAIDFINKLVNAIDHMSPAMKHMVVWIGAFLFLLGPATWALGLFLKLFLGLKAAMTLMSFAGFALNLKTIIPLLWKGAAAMAAMAWQATLIAAGLAALYIIVDDIVGYFTGKDSVIIPGLKKLLDWYMSYSDNIWRMWKSGFDDIVTYFREIWTGAIDWLTNLGPWKWLEGIGGKIYQWTHPGKSAAAAGFGSPSPAAAVAATGAGQQISVSVGSIAVSVPEGTSKEQRDALKSETDKLIKTGIMDQIRKGIVYDIQSGTRR